MLFGCVGGIGEKTARGFNRATQALRQTGSAGKPIAILAPAIDKKIITASSIYVDEETIFDDGTEEGYAPTDYNKYRGEITVRQAVESSQNIPFVKIIEQLTPKESIKYMKKFGITTLTKNDENLNLALGGLDKGISPLEMAAAYSTIANDGVYIEPTFYTKVENSIGKTVIKSKQKKKKVMSEEVSYILKSILTEPVNGSAGTAKYCKIDGIDVAAKTGTTNEEFDRWLCGFTPYYTGVTWFGFDLNETINFNKKNPSGQIWSSVMKTIHSDLSNKSFVLPHNNTLESARICSTTGLLTNDNCSSYTEYYLEGTSPIAHCDKHSNSTKTTSSKEKEPIEETPIETPNIPEPVVPEPTVPVQEEVPNVTLPEEVQPENTVSQNNTVSEDTNAIDSDDFISDDDIFEQ